MTTGKSRAADAPLSIEIEKTDGCRCIHLSGMLTDEGLKEALTSVWEAPDYDPYDDEIYDFSAASARDLSPRGLFAIAEETLRRHADVKGTRVAIVAPTDLNFGLGRQYGAIADNDRNDLGVFRDFESARVWVKSERL